MGEREEAEQGQFGSGRSGLGGEANPRRSDLGKDRFGFLLEER